MNKDNGTFCGEPLINLSTRGIGTVQQCSQVKYIRGIPKKGTVDSLNIKDGYVYVDGEKQDLFDLKKDDWKEIWNSEYLVDLRDKQANGIKNPTCELCYFMGDISKRARYVKFPEQYENLYKKESPSKIELRLSNECNLSCRFFSPINSSIYEKEMLKLSNNEKDIPDVVRKNYVEVAEFVRDKKKTTKFLRDTFDSSSLPELIENAVIVEMHGGEPTLENKLWDILDDLDLSEKEFICYSNIIKLEQKHIDILNRFKSGRFIASIDVADESINYCRYPAQWSDVSKKVQLLKKFKKEILINPSFCLQIYNMFRVVNNIKWLVDTFKEIPNHRPMFNVIQKPPYLSPNLVDYEVRKKLVEDIETKTEQIIQVLDYHTKKLYREKIKEYTDFLKIEHIEDSIPDVTSYVQNKKLNVKDQLKKEFWDFTNTLDRSRGQKLFEFFPELEGFI